MAKPSFKPGRYRTRWFSFFDLLGFTALVRSQKIEVVMHAYEHVLEHFKVLASPKRRSGVLHSWFSDSFIVYSGGSSKDDFELVESASRRFFRTLTTEHVPVRGALTFGGLYSQSKRNIFVGPALIDAYQYCEDQNWLGFVLTPSVRGGLKTIALDLDDLAGYELVPEGVMRKLPSKDVHAFKLDSAGYATDIATMKAGADAKFHTKYDKTLAFMSNSA